MENSRKNIIFIFSDQQRFDTVNAEIMPNLTALADEGTFFENCFSCQPVCGPARACLQSGVYPTQTGCFINGIALPEDTKTIADCFNENGYDTAYIGKWHLASGEDFHCETTAIPKERLGGYSYFRGADVLEFTSNGYAGYIFDEDGTRIDFDGYRVDCISNFALEYIENAGNNNPFFMMVSILEPHHQNNEGHFVGYKETVANYRNYPLPEDLRRENGDAAEEYPDYLSAINRIDYNLGRITEKLKENGMYENTIIIYTSDHGCHFKTRNSEYKRSCHESSIHVPLVISGADFGTRTDSRLVSLIDIPATLLSLAGISVPKHFQGLDLCGNEKRENIYIQISESQCGRAIRTDRYKYSVCIDGDEAGYGMSDSPVYYESHLYDLQKDPYESNNLICSEEYKSTRAWLKKLLLNEMEKAEGRKAEFVSQA